MPNPLILKVTTGDNCPSKKNAHFPLTNGGLGIDAGIKKRMEIITRALLSALISESQTIDVETLTGCSPLSWIVSRMPGDDSLQWIPEIHVTCQQVSMGDEGFDIEITQINEK
jgi:hypothetical protein